MDKVLLTWIAGYDGRIPGPTAAGCASMAQDPKRAESGERLRPVLSNRRNAISKRTIVWLVSFMLFSAVAGVDAYKVEKPCREYRASHPGFDPKTDPDEGIQHHARMCEGGWRPCSPLMWRYSPWSIRLYDVGWLVSLFGFLSSLIACIYRRMIAKRGVEKGDLTP